MKKIPILFLLVIVPLLSYSQVEFPNRWYMGMTFGVTIPLGDYSQDEMSEEGIGYAKTGFGMTFLQVAHFFHPNAGMYVDFGFSHNEMKGNFSNDFLRDNWNHGTIILGGVFSWLPFPKMNIDFKVGIGALVTSSPYTSVNGPDRLRDFTGGGFSYQLATGLRFHMSDKVSLMANADYQAANTNLKGNGVSVDHDFDFIKLTLGLGYRM